MPSRPLIVLAALTLFAAAGCGYNNAASGGGSATDAARALPQLRSALHPSTSQYISHIIVIVQENRSFENFFAGFPGANAPLTGCVAPHTGAGPRPQLTRSSPIRGASTSGCPSGDTVVALHQITFQGPDMRHDWHASMADYDNGHMDGFWQFGQKHGQYQAYAYVQQSLIAPYWQMAQQYVLADAMYPTEFGGSFTAHLTLVAGTDNLTPLKAEVDFPSSLDDGCDSAPGTKTSYVSSKRVVHPLQGPFPCFKQFNSIANVLDGAGISWKYYTTKLLDGGLWEPFEALSYVRKGPDWSTNIIAPQTQILTDAANGQLASVSFVTPSKADSDHPKAHSDTGPAWVASVVNAIGESPYWNSSAIVVLWDDWGGWYDNANPPFEDYRGLGIRVPCLIISPYARETSPSQPGYVSHTQYEFGSILRFIEETFNLPSIGPGSAGYTDARAASISDSFDFTQAPRTFTPFGSKYSRAHFLHEPPSNEPVDEQ
jgi:phospholipase C